MVLRSEPRGRIAGTAAIAGGILGVFLGPIMVMVKYQTGWAVIPEPAWIAAATPVLGPLLNFGTPVTRWIVYGSVYTFALVLMFVGLLAAAIHIKERTGRAQPLGLWVLLVGLGLVIAGDAVHTATWHQNGLTVPTPGTNPVANTGYATHMMGMNLVMVGSLVAGIAALRRHILATWIRWALALLPATIVVLSLTLLPTTPGGGLWMFSVFTIAIGYSLRSGKPRLIGKSQGPIVIEVNKCLSRARHSAASSHSCSSRGRCRIRRSRNGIVRRVARNCRNGCRKRAQRNASQKANGHENDRAAHCSRRAD